MSLALAFSTLFTSCDEVDKDDYLPELKTNANCPEPQYLDSEEQTKRNVLLEEYTGHKCGNCPSAAKEAKALLKEAPYNENLVVVAIHGNSIAFNQPEPSGEKYRYDFRTEIGKKLDAHFGVTDDGIPAGLINRKDFDGFTILPASSWKNFLDQELSKSPKMSINMVASKLSNEEICASLRVKMLDDYSGALNYNVFVVENGIINWQLDYKGDPKENPNYEHNHILRYTHLDAFGYTLGESKTNYSDKETFELSKFSIPVGKDWNLNNIKVIAYVSDKDSKEILQVKEIALKQ